METGEQPQEREIPARRAPAQARALRTRAALLAAVDAIVAAEGPAAVTTTSVAEASGVSVGTIYRYFPDREALLLAAYDASVERIVQQCAQALQDRPKLRSLEDEARRLLALYLATAEADTAHAGLLVAMRAIRPIALDQRGGESDLVADRLMAPLLARHALAAPADDIVFLRLLMGAMVDLYLLSPAGPHRQRLAGDIEAHMLLALDRAVHRAAK